MAKKPQEPWQPMLLDVNRPLAPEPRVDYDDPGVRVRKAGSKAPLPPAEPQGGEPIWWARARTAEQGAPTSTAQTTWGAEWHRLLRMEGWTVELPGGKRALLERAVRHMDVRPGVLEGAVGVGSERPERVQVRQSPVGAAEWTRLARHIVDRKADAAVIAGLEGGEIPIALVDAADTYQTALLPRRLAFLSATCTCGGANLPCDHLLAVHLAMARRLYKEPLLLLRLRGIDRGDFVALLHRVREEAAAPLAVPAVAPARDPYAAPDAPPVDWSRLDRPPLARPPLPAVEGWRTGSIDATVRHIVAALRAAGHGRG